MDNFLDLRTFGKYYIQDEISQEFSLNLLIPLGFQQGFFF